MGDSFFDENGGFAGGGFEPVYNGAPVSKEKRRKERMESKAGRFVLTGEDETDKRRDRLPVYALLLGILSILCVFFANGYLISMLGLLVDAHALNKGTKRQKTAVAAAVCCAVAILIYIVCVAARPLLSDMPWYVNMIEKINRVLGN